MLGVLVLTIINVYLYSSVNKCLPIIILQIMKIILIAIFVYSLSILFAPQTSFSQSKEAINEVSSLFKSEGNKLCVLCTQFEDSKNTNEKIKTLDDIYLYFDGFMRKAIALSKKYPELGDLSDESSVTKDKGLKFFECVEKFGIIFTSILETEQKDEKFMRAFEEFSKKMEALSVESDKSIELNDN